MRQSRVIHHHLLLLSSSQPEFANRSPRGSWTMYVTWGLKESGARPLRLARACHLQAWHVQRRQVQDGTWARHNHCPEEGRSMFLLEKRRGWALWRFQLPRPGSRRSALCSWPDVPQSWKDADERHHWIIARISRAVRFAQWVGVVHGGAGGRKVYGIRWTRPRAATCGGFPLDAARSGSRMCQSRCLWSHQACKVWGGIIVHIREGSNKKAIQKVIKLPAHRTASRKSKSSSSSSKEYLKDSTTKKATRVSMEVSSYLVSWFITYLRDLWPS